MIHVIDALQTDKLLEQRVSPKSWDIVIDLEICSYFTRIYFPMQRILSSVIFVLVLFISERKFVCLNILLGRIYETV